MYDIIPRLSTGDIILVSYRGTRTIFSSTVYGSRWTHPALIVIDDATSEPFVLEAADYNPPYSAGLVKVPLIVWARINRNAADLAYLRLQSYEDGKTVSARVLEDAFAYFRHANATVENLSISWVRFLGSRQAAAEPPVSLFAEPKDRRTLKKPSVIRGAGVGLLEGGSWSACCISASKELKPSPWQKTEMLRKASPNGEIYEPPYAITCHEAVIYALSEAGVFDLAGRTPCSFLPSALACEKAMPKMVPPWHYADPVRVSIHALAGLMR